MNVYVIFDPAGLWELGPAIFARREDAEAVVKAHPPRNNAFGTYALRVEEIEVH